MTYELPLTIEDLRQGLTPEQRDWLMSRIDQRVLQTIAQLSTTDQPNTEEPVYEDTRKSA